MTGYRTAIAQRTWAKGWARFEDGWIIIDEPEPYLLQTQKNLAFALAGIRDHHDALDFANHHGLLVTEPRSNDNRELFSEWELAATKMRGVMQLYVTLGNAIKGKRAALEKLRMLEPRIRNVRETEARWDDHDLLCAASLFIEHVINEELAGVEQTIASAVSLEDGSPGSFAFTTTADTLLAYAYYDLATRIVSHTPMTTCVECDRAFVQKDKRQKYCEPKCATRARNRRRPEKQAVITSDG